MKRTLLRATSAAAVALTTAGLAVAVSAPADAAVLGAIASMTPATGTATTPFSLVPASNCPTGTIGVDAFVDGPAGSGWTAVPVTGFTSAGLSTLSSTGVASADNLFQLGQQFADPATGNITPLTLVAGRYTFTIDCIGGSVVTQTNLGTFTGQVDITGTGTAATFAFVQPVVTAPSSSTAAVTSSVASPVTAGTSVTFSTRVTSTATVATTGSVQFFDGATALGAAQPVSLAAAGSATASVTTTTLAGGPHSITAKFTPATPTVLAASDSTASPLAFVVTTPTTLSGSFSPAAPTTADVVVLTVNVAPAGATGSVAFSEAGTQVGQGTVTGGVATASLTGLTAATHTFTATYTPTAGSGFLGSTTTITVPVVAFAGVSATETVTTTIGAGTLTITAGAGAVDLGTPTLNGANNLLVSAPKDLNPITVTDTRAGQLGYTVSGVVGDFTGTNPANKISSANLGWTPKSVTVPASVTATLGAVVNPANGVAPTDPSTAGLKSPRNLVTTAPGASIGTSVYTATLLLQAPTSTKPDSYTTTLTLTAI